MSKSISKLVEPKGKRGRKTDICPKKLELIEEYEAEYLTSTNTGDVYRRLTNEMINKFGYEPASTRARDGYENMTKEELIPSLDGLPVEEREAKAAERAKIDAVLYDVSRGNGINEFILTKYTEAE